MAALTGVTLARAISEQCESASFLNLFSPEKEFDHETETHSNPDGSGRRA